MVFVFATTAFRYLTHFSFSVRQIGVVSVIFLLCGQGFADAAFGAESVLLEGKVRPGMVRQIRGMVEIEGRLTLNPDGKEIQHIPLKAQAELRYHERLLSADATYAKWRAVRSYRDAAATIKLRDTELKHALREDRRLIAIDATDETATQFSPQGPLTREELELIEAPASGIVLEALLPNDRVKPDDKWPVSERLFARMLGLEAVSQHNVECTLQKIEDGLAIVALEGTIAGAVGGVSSDIELKGKLNYDLKKQMVTWLTLAYHEKRAIGHAQPGFEVLTKLRLVAAPASMPAELSDATLAGMPLRADSGQTLLDFTSESGGYQLVLDRRWRVMLERHDATILRFVDRGDLIGQCNLSPRPPLTEGHQLTLEGFGNDVKQALGKNFGQVVAASQEVMEGGIQVLRVVVSGTASELPIQWTYYHLSDDHGRRASLAFTMESKLVEEYPEIDRQLIEGFRFLADREPQPAKKLPTAAKSSGEVR